MQIARSSTCALASPGNPASLGEGGGGGIVRGSRADSLRRERAKDPSPLEPFLAREAKWSCSELPPRLIASPFL